jgi:hypothetical protein
MAGVDIRTFRFDFDLTFAALLMNADGTIYHTYAGRDWEDAQSHLSVKAFASVLEKTLPEHEAYGAHPKPPTKHRALTIEEIPPMAERIRRGKQPECFHCHMVHDAIAQDAKASKTWKRDDIWIWPDPVEVGLRLDRDDQSRIREVVPRSPADVAGLRPGDHVRAVAGAPVLTFGDVQRALDEAPSGANALPVAWTREGKAGKTVLRLEKGWKEADPLVFSWRPSKWPLSPKPGFGGKTLGPAGLARLGLPEDAFALRVNYVVTWGPNAHTGRSARKAGIRKGDVVVSVGGKSDFRDNAHLHAWFRLTQKAGTKVSVERIRGGKRETLEMEVVD